MPWIDLETWPRRAIYDFHQDFEDPWFNLTADVEVGPTWRWCKDTGAPFSLACWFVVQEAANAVENLRLRMRGDRVWLHDRVRVGATVLKPDDTFTYAYYPDEANLDAYVHSARLEQAQRMAASGLAPDGPDDILHCTVIPWVRFTGIKHAQRRRGEDSIPKIALGKATPAGSAVRMPVSLQAHHALVDGLHAGRFFTELETRFSTPGAGRDDTGRVRGAE